MTAKLGGRRARTAAAQLEIDRVIVARRLSGVAAQRTTLRMPFQKSSSTPTQPPRLATRGSSAPSRIRQAVTSASAIQTSRRDHRNKERQAYDHSNFADGRRGESQAS
jgi:hypothetical protein